MNTCTDRKPVVSVVIPVYNAGGFIEKCVRSALGQTLRGIEVICVNDCSTDRSADILKGIRDPRLKIIEFPVNQGVSAARNAGMDAAEGEFVHFLDSDDWLDADYLEGMAGQAERTGEDIVINSNYIEEFPESGKRAFSSRFGFVGDEPAYYPADVVQNRFPPVVWARLFRRAFLLENKVRFPSRTVRDGTEDIFFASLAGSLTPRAFVFRGPFYHYLQRPESLLHQRDLCYHNIVSFKFLHDERLSRGLATEGLRLFYGGQVFLDTEDKFDFVKPFFSAIAPEVRRHADLYAPVDLFLMEAVLSSPDYTAFRSRFNPNISLSFIRSKIKKN